MFEKQVYKIARRMYQSERIRLWELLFFDRDYVQFSDVKRICEMRMSYGQMHTMLKYWYDDMLNCLDWYRIYGTYDR